MAGRSHYSFNKRQKEIKQKEKAEKKMQRRLEKRQGAVEDPAVAGDNEGGDTSGSVVEESGTVSVQGASEQVNDSGAATGSGVGSDLADAAGAPSSRDE